MQKKELKKANGDVFFQAERKAGNSYIQVNWIGIQSLETIMMGAGLLLNMLRELPCSAILYSNQELIGPWEDGAFFLGSSWAPKARNLGVECFAHVLAPGIYGRRSFQRFEQLAQHQFRIEAFETIKDAEAWLQE